MMNSHAFNLLSVVSPAMRAFFPAHRIPKWRASESVEVEAIIINIVWIVSGLGIILYPAILLANVMSLRTRVDDESTGTIDYWRRNLTFKAIQVLTTLFPVIDYACQRLSRTAYEAGTMAPAIFWMVPPLLTTISIFWIFKRSRSGIAV